MTLADFPAEKVNWLSMAEQSASMRLRRKQTRLSEVKQRSSTYFSDVDLRFAGGVRCGSSLWLQES